MDPFENQEVILIDDNSSQDVLDVDSPGNGASQGSVKGLTGFACSSQDPADDATKSDSGDTEILDFAPSQESPFLIPSRPQKVSTPFWKDHLKQKRKCEDAATPATVTKRAKITSENSNSQNGSSSNSNGTGDHAVGHVSFEEHTYARKITSSDCAGKKKSDLEEEEEEVQKIQVELTALCTILYTMQKKEVVSIKIDQLYNLAESLNQSSLSSGRLADDSDSSHHESGGGILKPRVLNAGRLSTGSSTATTSSGSSLSRKSGVELSTSRGFQGAHVPLRFLCKPEVCVCSKPCVCSLIFESKVVPVSEPIPKTSFEASGVQQMQAAYKSELAVTSTSNSDENYSVVESLIKSAKPNIKIKKSPLPKKTVKKRERTPGRKKTSNVIEKSCLNIEVKSNTEEEVSSSVSPGVHQCPPGCKFGKDLLVYAKWPADKVYYPALIHNCFFTDWEYSNNLVAKFFDGASVNLSSCNIFPASLIVKDTLITYRNDEDEYIDGILCSVERKHPVGSKKTDTCLSYIVKCDEEDDERYGEILNVPFTSTALNDFCYKKLKKEIGESILTPHKFSRNTYDVCYDNLLEGKRKRRGAEEAVSLIVSESLRKKDADTAPKSGGVKRRRRKRSESSENSCNKPEDANRRRRPLGLSSSSQPESHRIGRLSRRFASSESKSCCGSAVSPSKQSCRSRKTKSDRRAVASTSTNTKPSAIRELVFRKDVISEEEQTDSETEESSQSGFDVLGVGGGDIDYECSTYTHTSRKSCGNRIVKSSANKAKTVTEDDESLVKRCGPIPSSPIFAGYSFVLTHGGPNSFYRNRDLWADQKDSEQSTDYDEIFSTTHAFDHQRLQNQITAGRGVVYNDLLSVPKGCLPKTLVISDYFCRTANYLLAATLNIPVYSHQLIVLCCTKNDSIEKILKSEVALPVGITSDRTWHNFNKKRRIGALKGYTVVLATSENNYRLKYWAKIINLSGGKISFYTSERNSGGPISLASVVIVDDFCSTELLDSAAQINIPVVSTKWLVDTVIRGHKLSMISTDLPQYRVDRVMSSQPSPILSQSQ